MKAFAILLFLNEAQGCTKIDDGTGNIIKDENFDLEGGAHWNNIANFDGKYSWMLAPAVGQIAGLVPVRPTGAFTFVTEEQASELKRGFKCETMLKERGRLFYN